MIVTSQVHHCRECGSAHIVRSGRNRYGSQQYQCRDCGASKAEVLCARQERSSLRGLRRTFGITRKTITRWLKKLLSLPAVEETLSVARASDVIEFDEAWSFVWRRKNKRWLWTVMCRLGPARSWPSPTATIARVPAGHFGSRCRRPIASAVASVASGRPMWAPPGGSHRSAGKETGETAHMERWYNTLRQHTGCFVRKTLSFSKKDW